MIVASCLCLVGGCRSKPRLFECRSDQISLERWIDADRPVEVELRSVDSAASRGAGSDAADRIETRAAPKADQALAQLRAWHARTRWGHQRHAEWIALWIERRGAMVAYAQALRSDDLARVVGQMEVQRDIEKKAVGLERAIRQGPEASRGDCEPPP